MSENLLDIPSTSERKASRRIELPAVNLMSGLTRETVAEISNQHNEPDWLREFRLQAFETFQKLPLPPDCAELATISLDSANFLRTAPQPTFVSWEAPDVAPSDAAPGTDTASQLSEKIRNAASAAEIGSEGHLYNLKAEWKTKGVLFLSPEQALKEHPELFRQHFGTVVSPGENKLAALNSAVWSGGVFIYVPKGVVVSTPLQTQLRLSRNLGQFERTLIVVDEGAFVHYVEGCSAPANGAELLHAGVVEIVVKRGARCRFTTIQNFPTNVYNVVNKGAVAMRDSTVQWVDGNIGGRLTVKHPFVKLTDCGARAEVTSIAFAGKGQHHDIGARIIHSAPHTTSQINNRSVGRKGGRASFRALCSISNSADFSQSRVVCEGLLLDGISRVDAYPQIEVSAKHANVRQESGVRGLGRDEIFYLGSRGLAPREAAQLILDGFLEPVITELPMEYAVEMKRLIELEMVDEV